MTDPPAGPQNETKEAAVRGGAPAALREAAAEVLAADSAFARELDGADQRWDAALEGLRLALSENTVDSLDELDVERLARAWAAGIGFDWTMVGPDGDWMRQKYLSAAKSAAAEYRRLTATAPADASEEETNG